MSTDGVVVLGYGSCRSVLFAAAAVVRPGDDAGRHHQEVAPVLAFDDRNLLLEIGVDVGARCPAWKTSSIGESPVTVMVSWTEPRLMVTST